jgi:hypothetical protein
MRNHAIGAKRAKGILGVGVLCLAVFLLCQPAFAKTLTVDGASPKAADDNPGTAEAPFKTIQAAVDKAQPGETVSIRKGIYREEVKLKASGTSFVEESLRLLDETGLPLPELALRFVISNPDISTVLMGARSAGEVEQNVRAVEKGPLPDEIMKRVRDIAAMAPFRPYGEGMGLPLR